MGVYSTNTPGVNGGDNATLRLDLENEPQPDALLRLEPELGGGSRIDEDDYLIGAPELIAEIAASSASYDMHQKRRVYARNGIPEYLVILTHEQQVHWFVLGTDGYGLRQPDDAGILRSQIFPGLWLQTDALLNGDVQPLLATLQRGLDSPEHKEFVDRNQRHENV